MPMKSRDNELGVGQAWQDVKASRVLDTNYTNTTGRPIAVSVGILSTATPIYHGIVAGVIAAMLQINTANNRASFGFVVPPGAVYSVTLSAGTAGSIDTWSELR